MNNSSQHTPAVRSEPGPPAGVLACITAGFEITARRLWLALLPFVLDLFLWLGPRLSIAPCVAQIQAALSPAAAGNAANYQLLQTALEQLAAQFNLFSALSLAPLIGVPTLMATRMLQVADASITPLGARLTWAVAAPGGLWALTLLLGLVGLGWNALYLRQIGRSVIEETESPLPGPGSTGVLWVQLVVLVLLAVPALVLMALPLTFVTSGLLPPALGSILSVLFLSLIFYVVFHLVFVIPGLVQLRRPLLPAIWESALLVQVDFLRVLGLVLIALGVTAGLNYVWSLPEITSWATLIGLGGHAFVSTALTVALFVFYQERLGYLQALQQARTTRPVHSHVAE